MEPTPHLQLLTPADWPLLKAARLTALEDSPHAFMSRYEQECARSEAAWQQLFHASTWAVAKDNRTIVGLTRSLAEGAPPQARYLESIWVAPDHRRRGVFRSLLTLLARVERHLGATELLLWVMEDNHVARRAYAALGFQPTGERQLLAALGRFEQQLVLEIRRASL